MSKVFGFKPGLMINLESITYNPSLISTAFVKWCEITKIATESVGSEECIMIHVKNPEEYRKHIKLL